MAAAAGPVGGAGATVLEEIKVEYCPRESAASAVCIFRLFPTATFANLVSPLPVAKKPFDFELF